MYTLVPSLLPSELPTSLISFVLVLNEMVLVLDKSRDASTSTALHAEYEYEYENTWENQRRSTKNVGNSAVSCLGTSCFGGSASHDAVDRATRQQARACNSLDSRLESRNQLLAISQKCQKTRILSSSRKHMSEFLPRLQ
jgi:hypothetical protein